MSESISVGMAEIKFCIAPNCLISNGLGSCIALCLYDPVKKIAGMAHIVLPEATSLQGSNNGGKYAVSAVPLLLQTMLDNGASKYRLVAKMAGGAEMFSFPGQNSILKIGERNAETVREVLTKLGIPLAASDVGGNYGRSVHFSPETGQLFVKTINYGEKVI